MIDVPSGIIVQSKANGTLGREESLMTMVADRLNIPIIQASEKQIERSKVRVMPGVVAMGSVPFVKHALRQVGKLLPEHTPYPAVLRDLLYRPVQKVNSLAAAKEIVAGGKRLFIKPADGWKRFTGFVAEFESDYRFNGASMSKPVWVSGPVRFVSEWRAYVVHDVVTDIRFADHGGDRNAVASQEVIETAVKVLSQTGIAPAGYVIDFGVLETGETALIEMNDGFSFGAYDDLPADVYWNVTVSRWFELTR